MKRALKAVLVVALAAVATNASAQLGIKAGYVSSSDKLKANSVTISPSGQNGFLVGINYDIALSSWGLSIRPGVNYTYIGGESAASTVIGFLGINMKEREHALGIPIDFKYAYAFNNGLKLYAFAGPRFNMGLVAGISYSEDGDKTSINPYTGKVKYTYFEGDSETEDMDETIYNRFDMQLGLGAGVQYKALSMEVGYDWGLLNRFDDDITERSTVTLKRGQLFVGLGYSF
jgi:hypothetical protein